MDFSRLITSGKKRTQKIWLYTAFIPFDVSDFWKWPAEKSYRKAKTLLAASGSGDADRHSQGLFFSFRAYLLFFCGGCVDFLLEAPLWLHRLCSGGIDRNFEDVFLCALSYRHHCWSGDGNGNGAAQHLHY